MRPNYKPMSSSKTTASNYSFESIIRCAKLPSPPVAWDEFLDFTRMKPPPEGREMDIVTRRINTNLFMKFQWNYIYVYIYMLLFIGLLWRNRILLALMISYIGWLIICVSTEYDETYATFHHRSKIIEKEDRGTVGIIIAVIVFYLLSVLSTACFVLFMSLLLFLLHAVFRPIPNEYLIPSKVASEDFVDELKEETIHFGTDLNWNENQDTLRQRNVNSNGVTNATKPLPGLILPLGDSNEKKTVKRC